MANDYIDKDNLNKNQLEFRGWAGTKEYKDELRDPNLPEVWFRPHKLRKYVKDTYGLTPQEYYNKVMWNDKDYVPLCICGEPKKWVSPVQGYYVSCMTKGTECRSRYHAIANKNRENVYREMGIDYDEYKSRLGYGSPTEGVRVNRAALLSKWLNGGNLDDVAHFYIAKPKDGARGTMKFGVSTDVDNRSNFMGFEKIKTLFTSTREVVGKLEHDICIELGQRNEYVTSTYEFRQAYNKYIKVYNKQ